MVRPCHEKEDKKAPGFFVSKLSNYRRSGQKRCGKSSRFRWNNDSQMGPNQINQEKFTKEEEDLIIKMHAAIGSRWAIIAQQLPRRSESDVKNHWNSKLRKKLQEMGIDPITHKPFSQIFADFGCINNVLTPILKSETSIASINKDLKYALTLPQMTNNDPSVSFFNYDNHPTDLLSQLQAIRFVTKTSNWPNPSPKIIPLPPPLSTPLLGPTLSPSSSSPIAPSLSSSSSSCNTVMAFSWQDFLLDDDLLALNETKEPKDMRGKVDTHVTRLHTSNKNNEGHHVVFDGGSSTNDNHEGFVESIMHKENEIFLGLFPDQLLDEQF